MPNNEIDFATIERMFKQRDEKLRAEQQAAAAARRKNNTKGSASKRSGHTNMPYTPKHTADTGMARRNANPGGARLREQTRSDVYEGGGKRVAHNNEHTKFPARSVTMLTALFMLVGAALSGTGGGGSEQKKDSASASGDSFVNAGSLDKTGSRHDYTPEDRFTLSDGTTTVVFDSPVTEEATPSAEPSGEADVEYILPIEHVSDVMIDNLKNYESFQAEAYRCPSGKLTIGWGHTNGVYEGQVITEAEGEQFLREDVASSEEAVLEKADELGVTLTQGQLDAFVDFAFNCGNGAFRESGLMELIAEGDVQGAADLLRKYVKGKDPKTGEYVVMGGLVKRRELEASWLLG